MSRACYLIRHGHAGRRGAVDDDLRPLTPRGRRQAESIADTLAACGITRILSSPFVRCVETVEPLGTRIGVAVEPVDALGEGNPAGPVLDAMAGAAGPIALCSHGDVIGDVIRRLIADDVAVDSDRLDKGGVWIVAYRGDRPDHASFVLPS